MIFLKWTAFLHFKERWKVINFNILWNERQKVCRNYIKNIIMMFLIIYYSLISLLIYIFYISFLLLLSISLFLEMLKCWNQVNSLSQTRYKSLLHITYSFSSVLAMTIVKVKAPLQHKLGEQNTALTPSGIPETQPHLCWTSKIVSVHS